MGEARKYACPHCGATEYATGLNSYDIYCADASGLTWRKTENANETFELYCRECGERAPAVFEKAAQ